MQIYWYARVSILGRKKKLQQNPTSIYIFLSTMYEKHLFKNTKVV